MLTLELVYALDDLFVKNHTFSEPRLWLSHVSLCQSVIVNVTTRAISAVVDNETPMCCASVRKHYPSVSCPVLAGENRQVKGTNPA